ncbi:MAG: cytochrome C, partial [Archangium sp.]
IDVKALTPPRADGTYAPGSSVTFQLALRDGAGKRLHPEGSLPSYNEVIFGQNEPGIQYYRAFFDATTTYYRRKHRERMLMTQIIGPAQRIQPIRTIVDLDAFLDPTQDVQTIGTLERDGVYAQFQTFPPANKLFGGAFFPEKGLWDAPVTDTWTYTLPANAEPGTYLVTVKGRRVYMGEDIPASRTLEIQVGTPQHTEAKLTTGPCTTCHTDGGEFTKVLHANDNRAACAGCHAPLGFELEGPIVVRAHFIHSRSDRFGAPKQQCSSCHLSEESTQRTSKAACLSCHTSYPDSHVAKFGPIESMYVGGGRESFQQCTGSCHRTHPGSGL